VVNVDVDLTHHFEQRCDEDTYMFVVSDVQALAARTALVSALAELMARNKCDPAVTADLLRSAGWDVALAPLRAGRISVRRGDFAEVLAAESAESFDGLLVPVRKLRYQIDPNQTLPGNDVVGLVMSEAGVVDDLEFIESKYRTTPSLDIAVDAHEQLAEDRDTGYATTINFMAHRLRELDPELYELFIDFLRDRGIREARHTVALCFDQSAWDERILERLDELDEHLPVLWVRKFPLDDAVALIDDVYARLKWDVIDHD
jgi:hypothetical protein